MLLALKTAELYAANHTHHDPAALWEIPCPRWQDRNDNPLEAHLARVSVRRLWLPFDEHGTDRLSSMRIHRREGKKGVFR